MTITDVFRHARVERGWERFARRTLDLMLAVLATVVILPLLLVTVVLIRLDSPGPVLFRQRRVGRRGSHFTFYKFRTMHLDVDDGALRDLIAREVRGEDTTVDGSKKLAADPRVTRVGRVLRRTSIDELPQLINVLRGEMSLVGPRPCLPWEAELFPAEFAERFEVTPGITGLWQVSGRSRLSTIEMLHLDVAYVRARSFWRDLAIIVLTIPTLLRGDGAR